MFEILKDASKQIAEGLGVKLHKEEKVDEATPWKNRDGEIIYVTDMLAHVKKEFQRRSSERMTLELQWRLNINFADGNQFVEINTQTKRIEETKRLFWYQEMEALNQIAPILETRQAKLKRLNLLLKARPASGEREDIASARLSNKLFKSIQSEHRIKNLESLADTWSEVTGTAFWKNGWDKDKGKVIGYIEDEEGKQQAVREGDLDKEVISPFEIFPDSIWNDTPRDCHSLLRRRAMHVDDIETKYGVRLEGKEVTVFNIEGSNYMAGGASVKSGTSTFGTRKKKDHREVFEYMENPSELYPEGRYFICTDDTKLVMGGLPYKVGDDEQPAIHYTSQKCIEKEGQFFGKSIVERLIPVQRRYNAIKNRKAEYLNRAAIGNLVTERNSIDTEIIEQYGIEPGLILETKPGTQMNPYYLQYPALPSTFEAEEESYNRLFVMISGVSEISRDSNAPVGVNSGIALQILQEQDETRLSLTGDNKKQTHIDNGRMDIRLYRQFANTPRLLKTAGQDEAPDVLDWIGSDLTTDDIFIEGATMLAETLAQRRQMVFDLLDRGVFNDPESGSIGRAGRSKLFEMLDMGNWEDFDGDDNSNAHLRRAAREIQHMLSEMPVVVAEYDDDILHISRHNHFRLSAEYEELRYDKPHIAEAIDAHIEEHIQALQLKTAQQQQQLPQEEGEMNENKQLQVS